MESRKIPNEAINAAAEWWTKRISGKVKHDNGDDSFGSIFAGMLADEGVEPLTDAQLQKFKNSLVMRISEKAGRGVNVIFLRCDYAPDSTLSDSARNAGIPRDNFPWKVDMRIENDQVEVSDGYGMPWARVWPVEHKDEAKEGAA